MLNKITLIFILSCAFSVVQAQIIDINPDNPGTYVVEKGDPLWGISERFLQEPWRWPETYAGVLMAFRTFECISYALVMEASGPLHMNDKVKSF